MSRGFSRKSYAPLRVASTAVSMFPCPLIMITGGAGVQLPHPRQDFQAVHLRHLDVEKDDIGIVVDEALEADGAVGSNGHAMRLVLEDLTQRAADRGVVVDDQDVCHEVGSGAEHRGSRADRGHQALGCADSGVPSAVEDTTL